MKIPVFFFVFAWMCALSAPAQTVMGTVSTHDAQVNGGLQVRNERADLLDNASVTAFDHTAPVTLSRGGEALVCSTSQFHLLHSSTASALLFGLDRGAFELHGPADAHDVLLTPDLRFAIEAPGLYDLRVRVAGNGDTCVDNAGAGAPVLMLADAFSSATYRLIPGQHVLFEHGSLREVVDNERSACGCPSDTPAAAATPAEREHPFPAAASAGLAPMEPLANSTPGQVGAQVTETLAVNNGASAPQPSPAAGPATRNPAAAQTSTAPPATPPGPRTLLQSIGHFFHKLFTPSDRPSQ